MQRGDLLLLSGNAHPELAEGIAKELRTELVSAKVGSFPDEETEVRIFDDVRDKDVFIIQPTGPPANENYMRIAIATDALTRASANRITAVMPYMGYARQDRKEASRVPISAKAVLNMLGAVGVDRFMAVDLHAHQIQGFTDLPFDHLYARKLIVGAIKTEVDDPVIATADVGGSKMMEGYADRLGASWAIVHKKRFDANTTEVQAIVGESVVGREVVVTDDMISTGGSLIKAADALKEAGASRVIATATHGIFSCGAVERIQASDSLDKVIVTNSLPYLGTASKIHQISLAPFLAEAIDCVHKGKSVSLLLD